MSAWPVIAGAFAAGLLAWAAIAAVALLGQRSLDQRPIRWLGAGALALLALDLAGAPVPWLLPPVLLVVGLGWGAVTGSSEASEA